MICDGYDAIQFMEFNPIIPMWTQHQINTEKLYFLTRETNNMDTEVDILAIYINSINTVNAFTNLHMDFIFSIRHCCKKKKDIRNILLLQTNGKHKVVKRKPVVGYDLTRSLPMTSILVMRVRFLSADLKKSCRNLSASHFSGGRT